MNHQEDIKNKISALYHYFDSDITKSYEFRLEQLKILKEALISYEDRFIDALRSDLSRSDFESYLLEFKVIYDELDSTIKNLKQWSKPESKKTPMVLKPASSTVYPSPYGVVLIISPWNYPVQLTFAPLLGAIAAGNCVAIKPSELSSSTSKVIESMIAEYFESQYISVINGGVEIAEIVLDQKFDYIFFTGSTAVGRIVMQKASKYLTPLTLELGGKSPAIVLSDADLDLAAKRIMWGKLINAGQTCIAPDYILVESSVQDQLITKMIGYIKEFYGESPLENPEYTGIINQRHFERLNALIDSEKILYGGESDSEKLKISPTILEVSDWKNRSMQEEIFGPVLPVLEFDNINEVISNIRNGDKPLALYLFSKSKEMQEKVIKSLSFGGGCINDTVVHTANPYLPFGGVGASGMGAYHGKASFDLFTHYKSVLRKSNFLDSSIRYAPYKNKIDSIKGLSKIFKL